MEPPIPFERTAKHMVNGNTESGARRRLAGIEALFLTHYARIGGPSRYRFYQYFPRLRESGIAPTVQFIQSEKMYRMKEREGRSPLFVLLVAVAYVRRMLFLSFFGRRYSVWIVEKEVFPALPYWFERLFIPRRAKVIVDYDDAVFLKYGNGSGIIFRLCRGKIGKVMHRADVVFAGNAYIAEHAQRSGATDIRWVPSVIDERKYALRKSGAQAVPVVGWIGSFRNSRHIVCVAGALRRLAAEESFVLRIVGGGTIRLPQEVRTEYRPWSEETELDELRQFTVGIMPLEDGEWEKGKCGLKLIQYLGIGVPVVATPIGINAEIVKPGVNGYLARTEDEWFEALKRVLNETRAGRFSPEQCASTVVGAFTISAQVPGIISAIRDLATRGQQGRRGLVANPLERTPPGGAQGP